MGVDQKVPVNWPWPDGQRWKLLIVWSLSYLSAEIVSRAPPKKKSWPTVLPQKKLPGNVFTHGSAKTNCAHMYTIYMCVYCMLVLPSYLLKLPRSPKSFGLYPQNHQDTFEKMEPTWTYKSKMNNCHFQPGDTEDTGCAWILPSSPSGPDWIMPALSQKPDSQTWCKDWGTCAVIP